MRQITIKSRDGRIRAVDVGSFDGDPNALLKDGETLVIPMVFMDAVPERGYQSFADDTVTDDDRKRVEDARGEMISRVSNRWKHAATVRPTPHQDGAGATPEAALAAYQDQLTNAWRKPR